MNKLILPDSFSWSKYGDPVRNVSLLDVSTRFGVDRDQLKKSASVLNDEILAIRPEPGTSVIHVIAMGASDTYGPNRNADGFTRSMLKKSHHTFVTDGHVYQEHRNKDPKLASGSIVASAYNDPMDRVELLIRVDNGKWANGLQKMASGQDLRVSMSCNVPYDVCQVPGCEDPISRTRFDYCDHMQKYAGRMLDNGVLVFVDNPAGRFFDLSEVGNQADRIAFGLRKVASVSDEFILLGTDLYNMLRVETDPVTSFRRSKRAHYKKQELRKLAEMEKQIEADISAANPNSPVVSMSSAFDGERTDDDEHHIDELAGAGKNNLKHVLRALGDARISLSLRDFVRIVMGKDSVTDDEIDGAESLLPGLFSKLVDDDEICDDSAFDCADHDIAGVPDWIEDIVGKLVPSMSIASGPAKTRVMRISVMGPKQASFRTAKAASAPAGSTVIARNYAKYKLSFYDRCAADGKGLSPLSVGLGVLQDYV